MTECSSVNRIACTASRHGYSVHPSRVDDKRLCTVATVRPRRPPMYCTCADRTFLFPESRTMHGWIQAPTWCTRFIDAWRRQMQVCYKSRRAPAALDPWVAPHVPFPTPPNIHTPRHIRVGRWCAARCWRCVASLALELKLTLLLRQMVMPSHAATALFHRTTKLTLEHLFLVPIEIALVYYRLPLVVCKSQQLRRTS